AIPAWLRGRFTAALNDALPPPHAAVLLGVVLGIREGIPARLQNALIATGLIHLLVLSGLKVAVFARIVQGALQPILGRNATWPAIALVSIYAMAGGATPAAVRASAMGGLAIGGAHLGRPSHVWTSLGLTAAGRALGAVAIVPVAAHAMAIPVTALVAYSEQVAYVLGGVPAASVNIPRFPTWMGVAYYSSLAPAVAGAQTHGNARKAALVTA